MAKYLIETYVGAAAAEKVVARLKALIEARSDGEERARYLTSNYLPQDEMCLVFVEGTLAVIEDVVRRAGLSSPRVVEASVVDG